MNRILILYFLLVIAIYLPGYSQTVKKINHQEQTWVAYFNQTRLSSKWGIWLDLHYRRTGNFFDKSLLAILRPGITYHVSDKVRLTLGYAFVNHFPAPGHQNISQPEHRGWQQIQWVQKYSGFNTMQYLRLEQRYRRKILDNDNLADGYNFNNRIRYNFALMIPLKRKTIEPKSFFLFLNDEIHINFGKEIIYNSFDQNRAFIGLAYQLDKHSNVQLGYLNVYQQLSSGSAYNNTHAIRLFFFHNLDFRKNEETQ